MIIDRKEKYIRINPNRLYNGIDHRARSPAKCPGCKQSFIKSDLGQAGVLVSNCSYTFRISAKESFPFQQLMRDLSKNCLQALKP